jgi:hypothetical protein
MTHRQIHQLVDQLGDLADDLVGVDDRRAVGPGGEGMRDLGPRTHRRTVGVIDGASAGGRAHVQGEHQWVPSTSEHDLEARACHGGELRAWTRSTIGVKLVDSTPAVKRSRSLVRKP